MTGSKPSKDINPAFKDHYFNVGLDYKPIAPLDFALVYKRDRANNGLLQPRMARSAAPITARTTNSACLGSSPSDRLSTFSPLGSKGRPLVCTGEGRHDSNVLSSHSATTAGYGG